MTRIIVCGGRDYADKAHVWEVLDELADANRGVLHVSVGYRRTDLGRWVDQWLNHRPLDGRASFSAYYEPPGHIRNRQMLDAGADLVVAFPGGSGTADMIKQARARGVPVREV